MLGEPKIAIDGAALHVLWWQAPTPVWAYLPGEEGFTPTITIDHPTLGATTLTLSGLFTPQIVSALNADRKSLTLDTVLTVSPGGAGQRFGAAWLVTDVDGYFDVTLRKLTTGAAVLAEPLAAPLTTGDTSTTNAPVLCPAQFAAVIPTAYLATTARDVPWTVSYKEFFGRQVSGYGAQVTGLMHFVRRPFETGVTSAMLAQMFPGLGARQPRRQGNFDAQIELAEAEIVLRLRADMLPRGLTEDDVSGARLRLAHATLAAAYVYDETEANKAEALRTRALGRTDPDTGRRTGGLLDEALRAVGLDSAQDGEIAVAAVEGDRVSDVSGGFFTSSAYTSTTRRFTVGEAH